MSFTQSALDTLIPRVISEEAQLSTILEELEGCLIFCPSLTLENVAHRLKDQLVSLRSVLSQARLASMTEQPGSGKDKKSTT